MKTTYKHATGNKGFVVWTKSGKYLFAVGYEADTCALRICFCTPKNSVGFIL